MLTPKAILKYLGRNWKVLCFLLASVAIPALILTLVKSSAAEGNRWYLAVIFLFSMLISLLVIRLAIQLVGRFVQSLYDLGSQSDGAKFASRSVLGQATFRPFLTVKDGGETYQPGNEDYPVRKIGGPASLVLYNDTAVILEREGKLTRVLTEPDFARMDRFERVYSTVDLRQRHWEYSVSALSKEGIPLTCDADVLFQINDGELIPTQEVPHPVDPEAVLRAGTSTWVRESDRFEDKLDWAGRVIISNTEGTLRSLLARSRLDQLIPVTLQSPAPVTSPEPDEDAIMPEPDKVAIEETRLRIQQDLFDALKTSCAALGVKILRVDLGEIKVQEEIAQQWLDLWRTSWRSWSTGQIAIGKADYIQALEHAKTDAQVKLLKEIAEAFTKLREENQGSIPRDIIAARLLEALGRTVDQSEWTRISLPGQTLSAIEQLEKKL
ncbi:MAG: SPFH domain-containing protein [Anaerolineae bacterium]|jgi:hypothetical protein|nr:SPFH domain-containing protein [Anaerolineae bacterium]